MKKTMLIHSEISYLIASLGHMDKIVIADSGLPIPKHVKKIDLALKKGVPGFIETLETLLSECCVERAWIAKELVQTSGSGSIHQQLVDQLGSTPLETISHEQFKQMVSDHAVAVIRTGEHTPYANVILQSGVVF